MKLIFILLFTFPILLFAQNSNDVSTDTNSVFKNRVLNNVEIDLLGSFYKQQGENAAVTGGVGTEELSNFASSINIAIPLSNDDILTIDASISAYSSASSSNLDPFSISYDDDNKGKSGASTGPGPSGDDYEVKANSPWIASSSVAKKDVLYSVKMGYSHYSDDRNNAYSINFMASTEFDYNSLGIELRYSKFFNEKNTELSFGGSVYLDRLYPQYPAEVNHYLESRMDLDSGFFKGVDILDKNGNPIDKSGSNVWAPGSNAINTNKRRTGSVSLQLSQIVSKRAKVALLYNVGWQNGWLASPMQRVYFADKENFYIGNPSSIYKYTHSSNTDVFHLADDIERLPSDRLKMAFSTRLSYFVNKYVILKVDYRYYFDNWDVKSNTLNIEMPIKLGHSLTIYPNYRFYNQSAAKYFAPYNEHSSTVDYYTSDYDLSEFVSNQYGIGIKYTDAFLKHHLWKIAFNSISLNYNYYRRNIAFDAHVFSLGVKLVIK